ncbi:MAG TPA: hypothetical protein PKE00_06365, partial [Planctomycetota bacterium]|nr:hypothetical protein [Planctomycetota bacterium]
MSQDAGPVFPIPMDSMRYIFVYGTLRSGGGAFYLLPGRGRFLPPTSGAGRVYYHRPPASPCPRREG